MILRPRKNRCQRRTVADGWCSFGNVSVWLVLRKRLAFYRLATLLVSATCSFIDCTDNTQSQPADRRAGSVWQFTTIFHFIQMIFIIVFRPSGTISFLKCSTLFIDSMFVQIGESILLLFVWTLILMFISSYFYIQGGRINLVVPYMVFYRKVLYEFSQSERRVRIWHI